MSARVAMAPPTVAALVVALAGTMEVTADAGSTVAVPLSVAAKHVAQVLAYAGTGSVTALGASAERALSTSHPAPGGTVATAGSWVLTYWVDKSVDTSADGTDLQAPPGLVQRGRLRSPGSTSLTAVLADGGAGLPAGQVGGATATTDAASRADTVTLVLAPAVVPSRPRTVPRAVSVAQAAPPIRVAGFCPALGLLTR